MNIEQHVTYALRNAPLRNWPFPHFYAENVFSLADYDKLTRILAEKQNFSGSEFGNRSFADKVDIPQLDFMLGNEFTLNIVKIFSEGYLKRFPSGAAKLSNDMRLVRDGQNYKIGPHTDAKWKMISLLFYMPSYQSKFWENEEYGTRLYIPQDRGMTCEGGPHYPFEPFDEVALIPYHPNTCFGFWKTNQSFHGVPPIPVQFQRDVLLFNVYEAGEK